MVVKPPQSKERSERKGGKGGKGGKGVKGDKNRAAEKPAEEAKPKQPVAIPFKAYVTHTSFGAKFCARITPISYNELQCKPNRVAKQKQNNQTYIPLLVIKHTHTTAPFHD